MLRLRHVKPIIKPPPIGGGEEEGGNGNDEWRLLLLAPLSSTETGTDTETEKDTPTTTTTTTIENTEGEAGSNPPSPLPLAPPVQAFMEKHALTHVTNVQTHTVTMDYSSFTVEEVLKQIFGPLGLEAPTSFETVDHIAHVNLRESHLPYKQLIAQVGLCVCVFACLFFLGLYVHI